MLLLGLFKRLARWSKERCAVADFFEFPTSADKQWLLDSEELRSIDPDGVIVNQGELQDAIFVLEVR